MAHELKAKHIQTETLENKADDKLLLRSILSYIEDHSSSFEDEDVVSKRFVEERLSSIGEEKYVGSIASIEGVDDDISEPEEDMLIVTRDTHFVYWYDGDEWQQIGGGAPETPESIKTKYESNENTNAFTDANQSKLAGIATGATKNANTDELSEGSENKYFTEARAVASKLAGYVKAATVSAISSATSILEAIGILEKALDNKVDKEAGKGLISDAEKLIFADKYTKSETDNLISGAIASLIWKDDVAEFADLATEYPDAIEGWTSVVNDENKIYRFDGTDWIPIGDITIPMATASVDGKMSKEDFVKLRDIEAEATKNENTDELDEGSTNKYFTEARAVAAKIAGYVKAETPIPLAETDSILQALGKLEGLLDGKLSLRGDNFIVTRPTADADWNGEHVMSMYNQLTALTPGGQPLSHTNRAILIVMPGRYDEPQYGFEFYTPYIDIIGFGSKHGIVLNGNVGVLGNDNHRLENLTIKGYVELPTHVDSCIYRNLTVDSFSSNGSGIFENIEHSGVGDYLFEALQDANLKNIYTPKSICHGYGSYVSGILENCRSDNELGGMPLSGKLINCTLVGAIDYEGIVTVQEGAEISYSTIINNPPYPVDECYAVNAYSPTNVKIHHCHFEGKTAPVGDNVINLIENGHNTWDSEGEGDGIQDIVAGTNISIDKTDPKNPIISSTGGGGGSGYETPAEVRDALQSLTGENRLNASAVKNLPSGSGLTPEQESKLENTPENTISELSGKVDKESGKGLSSNDYTDDEKSKLEDIEEEAQKNVQSDWNQSNNTADDYIKNKPTLFSGSWNDLSDKPLTYPPAAHNHNIEDVSGLSEALSGKVNTEEGKGLFAELDQNKVDAIDIDGDGTRFLTDDGTYKSELDPRTYIEESASGSVSIDLANKDVIHIEMSGNITSFNVTNPVVGKTYKIYMIQDSVGNRTLTGLDTKFKTENDIPILLSTDKNAVDLLQMDVFSSSDIKIFPVYNI